MPGTYQLAAHYFPGYHADPRNEKVHGKGWTEWDLLRRAEPRFPGHRQPRVPLWGYEDESDPRVFARKIDAAVGHGIDCLIFDWYWYDDGLFLGRALEEGFLRAINADRMKFAVLWANRDWADVHPAKLRTTPTVLHQSRVDRETFDRIARYMVERYFVHGSYWKIDGCPYFSIYQLRALVQGLGGPRQARDALRSLRERTKAAGFPDLHLNAVWWGLRPPPGAKTRTGPAQVLKALGFDSVTSYTWVHDIDLPAFPETDYERVAKQACAQWRVTAAACGLPYHPNVTMGCDSSPRTVQSDKFVNVGYPFSATLSGNTPGAFAGALTRAREYLDRRASRQKILTVNAWNQWTEGSYLEPDTVAGTKYLEAIRDVFGTEAHRTAPQARDPTKGAR